MSDLLRAGVIGVGTMGVNHARVYDEASETTLVGVVDDDGGRAASVADRYDTAVRSQAELLAAADVVSVAVPTAHHAPVARAAIEAGVHVLVEKPFVPDPDVGRTLTALADEHGVVLQVGHVERFNPAVATLFDVVDADEIVSVRADRLGPPVERGGSDGVEMDLMIHDIDIVLALLDGPVATASAAGTGDGRYCTAQLTFDSGVVGTLTASRVNQKRTRRLEVAEETRLIEVDYLDQSVRIHRGAQGSYEPTNGGVRYRNERVTEHPIVESEEPLKRELRAFVEAVRNGGTPVVTPAEAIRAVEMAHRIREQAATGEGGSS